nr:hypothetical protein [Rubrobacter indicoceani]
MFTLELIVSCVPESVMVFAPSDREKEISSSLDPAAHSPAVLPEAASEFAEAIASRSVHAPSSAVTSLVVFTVIVAALAGLAARVRNRSVAKRIAAAPTAFDMPVFKPFASGMPVLNMFIRPTPYLSNNG